MSTCACSIGGLGKTRLVRLKIYFANKPIGGFAVRYRGELALLRQPILQRPEHALRAPAIGRNMLNSQAFERAPNLGEPALVNRLASLRGKEIVAAAVGIETRRQTLRREHRQQRPKGPIRCLLPPPGKPSRSCWWHRPLLQSGRAQAFQ